jgi:hypothetical protein
LAVKGSRTWVSAHSNAVWFSDNRKRCNQI